jgi:hypothetical protein
VRALPRWRVGERRDGEEQSGKIEEEATGGRDRWLNGPHRIFAGWTRTVNRATYMWGLPSSGPLSSDGRLLR